MADIPIPLRGGATGLSAADIAGLRRPAPERVSWDVASERAVDAAHAWREVMGDRRKRERDERA